jgi:hypothetical protein
MTTEQQKARDALLVRLGRAGFSEAGARLALASRTEPLPADDAARDELVSELSRTAPAAYFTVSPAELRPGELQALRTRIQAERDQQAGGRKLSDVIGANGLFL